jgi:hypothetical protein
VAAASWGSCFWNYDGATYFLRQVTARASHDASSAGVRNHSFWKWVPGVEKGTRVTERIDRQDGKDGRERAASDR